MRKSPIKDTEKIIVEHVSCKWKETGRALWIKGKMWMTSLNDNKYLKFNDSSGVQKPKLSIMLDKEFEKASHHNKFLEVHLKNGRASVLVMFDNDWVTEENCDTICRVMKKKDFHAILGENIQTLNRKRTGNEISDTGRLCKANGNSVFNRVYTHKNDKSEDARYDKHSLPEVLNNQDITFVKLDHRATLHPNFIKVIEDNIHNGDNGDDHKGSSGSNISGCQTDKSHLDTFTYIRGSQQFRSQLNKMTHEKLKENHPNLQTSNSSNHFRFKVKPQVAILPKRPHGFPNGGADCYIIATLQCLFSMPEFVASLAISVSHGKEETMNLSLKNLFFWRTGSGFGLKPESDLMKDIKHLVKFDVDKQQDAHEFLVASLGLLEEENRTKEGRPESFRECLKMELYRTTTCLECKKMSIKVEVQNEICLSLNENDQNLSVQDYLHRYFQPVEVQHDCSNCEGKLAKLSLKVKKSPRILLMILPRYNKKTHDISVKLEDVHFGDISQEEELRSIKRSNPDPDDTLLKKIKIEVPEIIEIPSNKEDGVESQKEISVSLSTDAPKDFNVMECIEVEEKENFEPALDGKDVSNSFDKFQKQSSNNYNFIGCVSHLGPDWKFGHYVSDCLQLTNPFRGKWFSFNDSHVEETTKEMVFRQRSDSAYILFYMAGSVYELDH